MDRVLDAQANGFPAPAKELSERPTTPEVDGMVRDLIGKVADK